MKIVRDFSVTSAPYRPRKRWEPGELFANGAAGFWLDPSEPGSLFQDAAGTVPVTAPGQPVGLITDLSGFGLNASQGATARPTLGIIPATGRRNLASQTDDLTSRSAIGVSMSLSGPETPHGAVSTQISKSSLAFANTRLMSGLAGGTEYTVSILVRVGSFSHAGLMLASDGGTRFNRASFDLTTGGVSLIQQEGGAGPATFHFEDLGQWKRIAITATTGAPGAIAYFYPGIYNESAVGDVFAGALQIETASAPSAYQQVKSAFEITETGVSSLCNLHFDGVDDRLLTGTLDLSHTSQMTVIAGVEKLSDPTARGTVINFVDNGFRNFSLEVPRPTVGSTRWLHSGASTSREVEHLLQVGERALYTGLSDLDAPHLVLRANGAQVGQDMSLTGGGPFRSGPICIGDYVTPSGRRFHGRLYGLIVIDRWLTPTEIASAEAWMARKQGITI